jgi:hypothetical protein
MTNRPSHILKQRIYPYEESACHFCLHCAREKVTEWRMVGYDEHGELWICQKCWDQAIDTSQEQSDEFGENEYP